MEYEYSQIEERFKQLPEETQLMLSSVKTAETVKEIASSFGLNPDQESVLMDMVAYTLLGLISPADFGGIFSEKAAVDPKSLKGIVDAVNAEVFSTVTSHADENPQKDSAHENATITKSIAEAGGFEIVDHDSPLHREEEPANINPRGFSAFSSGEKLEMADTIEYPAPASSAFEPKVTNSAAYPMTEPLVDQLLSGAAAIPEEKVEIHMEAEPPANLPVDKDPYKEPLK